MLHRVLGSGVDLVRVNLSHGTLDSHKERIEATRVCALALGKAVGIIIDLQGPKIRIARFKKGSIHLQVDAKFIIDADR